MKSSLEREIEHLRKEMIEIGKKEGLSSEETLLISRKLDELIDSYNFFQFDDDDPIPNGITTKVIEEMNTLRLKQNN